MLKNETGSIPEEKRGGPLSLGESDLQEAGLLPPKTLGREPVRNCQVPCRTQKVSVTLWSSERRRSKRGSLLRCRLDGQAFLNQIHVQTFLLAFDINGDSLVVPDHQPFFTHDEGDAGRIGLLVRAGQVI
jgi:hypothetical protein